jgi:hypothetical protein
MRRESDTEVLPANSWNHPSEEQLERFMRAELPATETTLVVRHLLANCPKCQRVTRQLWEHGERVPKPKGGR